MKRILVFLAVILMISVSTAQDRIPEELKKGAARALSFFDEMITEENFRTMGFEKADEIDEAKLGEPIQVFMIRLDNLKEYTREKDPTQLLKGGNFYIYPIMVNGKVRSAMDMQKSDNTWKATGYGGSNLIKIISRIRNNVSEKSGISKTKLFVVRIPALSLYFIGYISENKLILTPTTNIPGYEFREGESKPAEDVLEILVPVAKEHNGEPG